MGQPERKKIEVTGDTNKHSLSQSIIPLTPEEADALLAHLASLTPGVIVTSSPLDARVPSEPAEAQPSYLAPWDGLSDASGPIPTFGPATLDDQGRVVMGEEERVARRSASIRMLAVIGTITGESDALVDWEDFSRSLERGG